MELHLKKNQAAEIMFPMVNTAAPDGFDTGETVTDTAYYRDGGSWTSLPITDTVTEISTTGMYTIELTAAEMNHDLIAIKFTSTNAADTAVVIRTFAVDADDLGIVGYSGPRGPGVRGCRPAWGCATSRPCAGRGRRA